MDETLKELKAQGIIKQREGDKFTLRLRMVGGRLEARFMDLLGDLAERYGSGHVHLTSRQLDKRVGRRSGLPHKCKIAVTGCPNRCVNTLSNDIGIMGAGRGKCAAFVGGKLGKKPRVADELPVKVAEGDDLCRIVEAIIDWYQANGEAKERFGFTLGRLGIESLLQALDGQG